MKTVFKSSSTATSNGTTTVSPHPEQVDVKELVDGTREKEAREIAYMAADYLSAACKLFHHAYNVQRNTEMPEWERGVARVEYLDAARTMLAAGRRLAFQAERSIPFEAPPIPVAELPY